MQKATTLLSEEHKIISNVIDALLKECDNLRSGKKLNRDFFNKAIDFIKNYADKFHHAKEEDILFKEMLKESENMHCNPIEQMLYEHDLARSFVKGIEEGLRADSSANVAENAENYCQLLKEHIFKEDNILYPMADEVLSQSIQESILELFKKGAEEKYLSIAEELIKYGKT